MALAIAAAGCGPTGFMTVEMASAYEDAKERGVSAFVEDFHVFEPNSAGGVSVRLRWHNLSDRTAKYMLFTAVPYNAVGDPVASEIGGSVEFQGRDTGPVDPFAKSSGIWENAWYNNTIVCAVLTGMEIEYMNGDTVEVGMGEVDRMFEDAGRENSCAYEAAEADRR